MRIDPNGSPSISLVVGVVKPSERRVDNFYPLLDDQPCSLNFLKTNEVQLHVSIANPTMNHFGF